MPDIAPPVSDPDYEYSMRRFDTPEVASRFALKKHDKGWPNLQELALVRRALSEVLGITLILDLPRGTGRIARQLLRDGHRVDAAGASPNMIRMAEQIDAQLGIDGIEYSVSVRDVLHTGYPENSFDAVVCNRLLHH